jgi:hypothetical protein
MPGGCEITWRCQGSGQSIAPVVLIALHGRSATIRPFCRHSVCSSAEPVGRGLLQATIKDVAVCLLPQLFLPLYLLPSWPSRGRTRKSRRLQAKAMMQRRMSMKAAARKRSNPRAWEATLYVDHHHIPKRGLVERAPDTATARFLLRRPA